MHAWIKLACAVLAWTILPAGVATASQGRPGHPVQVSTRTTILSFTSARADPASAPAHRGAITARTYVVQRGDTLFALAERFGVPGGWPALYAANRSRIGPDPNALATGTVLDLPGAATPVRYTVAYGETLSGIAAQFAVRGGWPALYETNRAEVGPDPGRIDPGLRLTLPSPAASPAASSSASPDPAPARPVPVGPGPKRPQLPTRLASPVPSSTTPAPSSRPTGHQAHSSLIARLGVVSWLEIILLAVGLAALIILIAEPLLGRRRRGLAVPVAGPYQVRQPPGQLGQPKQPGPPHQANSVPEAPVMPPPAHSGRIKPSRILIADHERLIITRDKRDDTICVLRPPGEDPADILRVARLVLPEGPYGTLAERLGISPNWPMDQ
jgi:LysM repeat protein